MDSTLRPNPYPGTALYHRARAAEKLKNCIDRIPESIILPNINQWAEDNRTILPGLSPLPGRHKISTAPYMAEITDCLHPDSPLRKIAVMKSVQSTATHHAENAIAYYIRYKLGSIGYYTSDLTMARVRSSGNIDTLIDGCGLGDYVKPISTRNARKTSDTTYYKEFAGGSRMLVGSYKSPGMLKSVTMTLLIMDEVDEAPEEVAHQGDTMSLLEGRTIAVRNPKLLYISTPKRLGTSKIHEMFLAGDQRYYHMPCPRCGGFQVLVLKSADARHGLTFTTERKASKRILKEDSVRYICRHCFKAFRESAKQEMLEAGRWEPAAVNADSNLRSYHVSGLMAPAMFLSWTRICQEFLNSDTGQDIPVFKNFMINYMGEPWIVRARHASWKAVKQRALPYRLGRLPSDASGMLYGAVDVQGDRLESLVASVGPGLEKWIVDYKVFRGSPVNPIDPVWESVAEYFENKRFDYCGRKISVIAVGVDCGYNPGKAQGAIYHTVHEFCRLHPHKFRAVRGENRVSSATVGMARYTSSPSGQRAVTISGDEIKHILYDNISKPSGAHATHVPKYADSTSSRRVPDRFYQSLMSEIWQENRNKKFSWVPVYKRNEVLDCLVYIIGLAYIDGVQAWSEKTWAEYHKELLA